MADTRTAPERLLAEEIRVGHTDFLRRVRRAWEAAGKPVLPGMPPFHPAVWMPAADVSGLLRARGAGWYESGTAGRTMVAAAAWAETQGIYRFDPHFAEELAETGGDDVPGEVLSRLPEWCVWVEADVPALRWAEGFFAYLDDTEEGLALDLVFLNRRPDGFRQTPVSSFSVQLGGTVSQAIARGVKQIGCAPGVAMPFDIPATLAAAVACVTYLCSEESEIDGTPSKSTTKRRARGLAPHHPTVWSVGARLGAAFQKAKSEPRGDGAGGIGRSPRPHVRRAHWHSFWRGSGEKRERFVKWLPPIFVAVDRGDIVPTIRPVHARSA